MTHVKTYPGMTDSSTEFFLEKDELKAIQNGKIKTFTELPFTTIEILKEEIGKSIDVQRSLHAMHPTSDMKRIEQFATCRFGGLDFNADIKDGEVQDGEYWPCPNHGKCPHEGILCKLPMINEVRLTKTDVKLMQLSCSEMTNEVIAEEMKLPLGSFHKAKKYIHDTVGVQTKQGIANICFLLNLI
jgi:hypothetical protein